MVRLVDEKTLASGENNFLNFTIQALALDRRLRIARCKSCESLGLCECVEVVRGTSGRGFKSRQPDDSMQLRV
jgi:hypothetical protein